MKDQLAAQLFAAALNFITAFLQNKDRTDIPAEMHELVDQAHAEMARINAQK